MENIKKLGTGRPAKRYVLDDESAEARSILKLLDETKDEIRAIKILINKAIEAKRFKETMELVKCKKHLLNLSRELSTKYIRTLVKEAGINPQLGGDYTLEEIGKIMNVTRERVRQIESMAIKKIKHPKVARPLSAYVKDKINLVL